MHSEKVPYYILDLLQQVPSVYVAGLGRFDAIFHPAAVDIHKSQIKPPFFEPGFNAEVHKYEDNLPLYMHYVSGIDADEAQDQINKFVDRIQQRVNSGETYDIEKFGSFSKSTLGHLHFTPDWDAFNLSFIGLETIDLHPVKGTKIQESDIQVAHEISDPVPAESIPYESPAETNWVTDVEPAEPERINTEIPHAAVPLISDSTSRLWWVILATALFLITILCGYLAWDILSNRDTINQYVAITNDTLANASPDIIIVDTLNFTQETLPEDPEKVVEPPPVEPSTPIDTEPPCFVVVGAFTNSDNVLRMEDRLKELGYIAEQIKGRSLTRVAIRTTCDRSTLQKTLDDARATINPEAWIY